VSGSRAFVVGSLSHPPRLAGIVTHFLVGCGGNATRQHRRQRAAVEEKKRAADSISLKHYETRKLKSLRSVKVHGEHVRRAFGFGRAARVTRPLIDSYIAKRRGEGAADATIDRETELLRRALTLGQEDGLVAYVPKVTHLVKGHANARQGFVERAEVDALLPELPSQVLREVAAFAYCTGMRKGEQNGEREQGAGSLPVCHTFATQVTGGSPAGAWAGQRAAYNLGHRVPDSRFSTRPVRSLGVSRRWRDGGGLPRSG
jgi:hypothetical protein